MTGGELFESREVFRYMPGEFAVLADHTVAGYRSNNGEFHSRLPFDRSSLVSNPWRAYTKASHFRFDFFPFDVALHLLPLWWDKSIFFCNCARTGFIAC